MELLTNILLQQLVFFWFFPSIPSKYIYRWPPEKDDENDYITEAGTNLRNGVYSNYPENQPLQYILRVYVIRGLGLTPKDSNNKSDPYIMLQLGKQTVNDREGYIACQSNPVFGKCYELHGNFPEDHSLTIKVLDRDTVTADDLIGETKIDVENRFYTKHRASCGLSESYYSTGPYKWRDNKKPSVILSNLCKRWGLDEPVYSPTSVLIGVKEFFLNKSSDSSELDKEVLALNVLSQWNTIPLVGFQLVPEHVETRSLFSPDKPGIEQGKLQLWIDIFSRIEYPIPDRVNITPRKPISYELRVIIWNTSDVILEEDDIFTGEKKSDIYIKGWLDDPKQCQYTDIHYRSLTGEGNFNWRFIYTFDYLSTENKIVVKKMHSMFSREESEVKLPCVVHLTIWDNDTFSQDDFLGSLNLELSKLPRGARSSQKCDLSIMKPSTKRLNLFKTRRTKGWWPFRSVDKRTKKEILGGKLEAEFEILTKEEAQKAPAGLGRQGPQALPPPKNKNKTKKICKFNFGSFRRSMSSYQKSQCIYCKRRKCWIALLFLGLTLVVLSVVLGLYFGGYFTTSDDCFK
ncbi:otoferlin-like [Rhynchophorus ferrugineus]|uniref:otoferlin-like n=1 Tax=Rhynchophorus ferrugineus TaxID=354439 RepID=UPI003FCDEC5B